MVLPFFMQVVKDFFTKDISVSTHSNGTGRYALEVSKRGAFYPTSLDLVPSTTHVPTVNPPRPPLPNRSSLHLHEISDRTMEMLGWHSTFGHDGASCEPKFLYHDTDNLGWEVCNHGVMLRRATDAYGTVLYR